MVLVVLHIFLQIILEMLPVSSSGNVTLFLRIFNFLNDAQLSMTDQQSFGFLLHGSAVIIIGCYFFKPWLEYLKKFLRFDRSILFLALFCIVADTGTVAFYFLFKSTGVVFFPLWLGFFITGCLLWSLRVVSTYEPGSLRSAQDDNGTVFFCSWHRLKRANGEGLSQRVCHSERSVRIQASLYFSIANGLAVGTAQGLALLPGISRFGATFVAARWLGFENLKAFELSFLIAWPLMLAGTVKGFLNIQSSGLLEQLLQLPILFSILIATILSWFVLTWVARLIQRGQLWKFCWWLWFLATVAFFLKKV